MVVLGIETATSVLSVGLVIEGDVIEERYMDENYAHAEKLPEFIQNVLSASQVAGDAIDLIAVSNGPGSFTGLRIGLALAKGLGLGWDCPLIAVPTLDAMAMQMPFEKETGVVLLTARKGEVYQAIFNLKNKTWERLGEIQCVKDDALGSNDTFQDIYFAGEGAFRLKEMFEQHFPQAVFLDKTRVRPNGGAVAKMGEQLYKKGERTDLDSVVPFYHKRFQGVA